MPHTDTTLRELADLFKEFEHHKLELAGRHSLARALASATDLLLDQSKADLHEQIKRLISMWFERVCKLKHLLRACNPHHFDTLRLHAENVELFNDPIFQLPSGQFDDDGFQQAANVLVAKPERDWTSDDRRRTVELHKKMAAMLARRDTSK